MKREPFKTTLKKAPFVAEISVNWHGIPWVEVMTAPEDKVRAKILYVSESMEDEPSVWLRGGIGEKDEREDPNYAIAVEFAKELKDYVQKTFYLPPYNPYGTTKERSRAIAEFTDGCNEEDRARLTDEAIRSCHKPEGRTTARRALDSVLNYCAGDEEVLSLGRTVYERSRAYWAARDYEQELAHLPADEYDAFDHEMADRKRTKAHNALIGSVLNFAYLSLECYQLEVYNPFVEFTKVADPYNRMNRNKIAGLAYEIVHDEGARPLS